MKSAATTCPNRSVCGPFGAPEGVWPAAEAGEEVALAVFGEFVRAHVGDAAAVNVSVRELAGGDEFFEESAAEFVVVIVVV
jgi:hypothetical protein